MVTWLRLKNVETNWLLEAWFLSFYETSRRILSLGIISCVMCPLPLVDHPFAVPLHWMLDRNMIHKTKIHLTHDNNSHYAVSCWILTINTELWKYFLKQKQRQLAITGKLFFILLLRKICFSLFMFLMKTTDCFCLSNDIGYFYCKYRKIHMTIKPFFFLPFFWFNVNKIRTIVTTRSY